MGFVHGTLRHLGTNCQFQITHRKHQQNIPYAFFIHTDRDRDTDTDTDTDRDTETQRHRDTETQTETQTETETFFAHYGVLSPGPRTRMPD